MLIDTHCHLQHPPLVDNLDQVIKDSQEHDVQLFICPGSSYQASVQSIELAQKYPQQIFPAVGIHPDEVKNLSRDQIDPLIDKLDSLISPQVVAIGECGLDFFQFPQKSSKRETRLDNQTLLFQSQIKLAQFHRLPLIIHSRQAIPQVIEILDQFNLDQPVIFHCFEGKLSDLQLLNKRNYYYGLSPLITRRLDHYLSFADHFRPNLFLLETDAPYLGKHPRDVKILQHALKDHFDLSQVNRNVQKAFNLSALKNFY
jgi:TatD DNase family protein